MTTKLKKALNSRLDDFGDQFKEIPRSEWPGTPAEQLPTRAICNRHFFVGIWMDRGHIRLSVVRTTLKGFDKRGSVTWADKITWDELMLCKSAAGFGFAWAVELYPPPEEVVNVANMRHLWILPQRPDYGWCPSQGID